MSMSPSLSAPSLPVARDRAPTTASVSCPRRDGKMGKDHRDARRFQTVDRSARRCADFSAFIQAHGPYGVFGQKCRILPLHLRPIWQGRGPAGAPCRRPEPILVRRTSNSARRDVKSADLRCACPIGSPRSPVSVVAARYRSTAAAPPVRLLSPPARPHHWLLGCKKGGQLGVIWEVRKVLS